MSHVVIVPGSTDLNRGDQALLWETARVINDASPGTRVFLIDHGDTDEELELQVSQTEAAGYSVLRRILPHPRRGVHVEHDKVRDGGKAKLRMMAWAARDLAKYSALLRIADDPRKVRKLLDSDQTATYDTILGAKALVVKGGGFLHSYGEMSSWYYIWYQLFYMRLAQKMGIPVIIMPNSFGPFEGFGVKSQIRKVIGGADLVYARESVSKSVLDHTLGTSTVELSPDLAYHMESGQDRDVMSTLRDAGVDDSRQTVGLTVRPYRFPGSPDPEGLYEQYVRSMASLAEHAHSKGYHPVFVAQVSGPSAHEDDRLAIRDVTSRIKDGTKYSVVDDIGLDCYDIESVYGSMNIVIGTRFHSVIFAQNSRVPSGAIAYGGNKSIGIMGDIGISDAVIPIESISSDSVCEMFDWIVNNDDNVRNRLTEWSDACKINRAKLVSDVSAVISR